MATDMSSLAMFAFVCCILSAAGLALYSYLHNRGEQQKLEQLKRSGLYLDLKAQLAGLHRMDIDSIRVECSGVTVFSVCPAHLVLDFKFKNNGNSLRNTNLTRLYAELIALDFPFFTQKRAYLLHRYNVYRPNGKKERAYAFVMRRGYKDYLLASQSPLGNYSPAQLRIY